MQLKGMVLTKSKSLIIYGIEFTGVGAKASSYIVATGCADNSPRCIDCPSTSECSLIITSTFILSNMSLRSVYLIHGMSCL